MSVLRRGNKVKRPRKRVKNTTDQIGLTNVDSLIRSNRLYFVSKNDAIASSRKCEEQ